MVRPVFISYRRDDTAWAARYVWRTLREVLGEEHVFLDVTGIKLGEVFPNVLAAQLRDSAVLLALIGPAWVGYDPNTRTRRIEQPGDFVALEIQQAFELDLLVVPVLVDGATIPRRDGLPASIEPLVELHAFELRSQEADDDLSRLVERLRLTVPPSEPPRKTKEGPLPALDSLGIDVATEYLVRTGAVRERAADYHRFRLPSLGTGSVYLRERPRRGDVLLWATGSLAREALRRFVAPTEEGQLPKWVGDDLRALLVALLPGGSEDAP